MPTGAQDGHHCHLASGDALHLGRAAPAIDGDVLEREVGGGLVGEQARELVGQFLRILGEISSSRRADLVLTSGWRTSMTVMMKVPAEMSGSLTKSRGRICAAIAGHEQVRRGVDLAGLQVDDHHEGAGAPRRRRQPGRRPHGARRCPPPASRRHHARILGRLHRAFGQRLANQTTPGAASAAAGQCGGRPGSASPGSRRGRQRQRLEPAVGGMSPIQADVVPALPARWCRSSTFCETTVSTPGRRRSGAEREGANIRLRRAPPSRRSAYQSHTDAGRRKALLAGASRRVEARPARVSASRKGGDTALADMRGR